MVASHRWVPRGELGGGMCERMSMTPHTMPMVQAVHGRAPSCELCPLRASEVSRARGMGAANPEYAKKSFEDDPRLRERFYVKPDPITLSFPQSAHVKRITFLALPLRASEWRRRASAQGKSCSCDHCASGSVLGFSINVPCLSQSHRTCPPTSISARRRRRSGAGPARAVQLPCTAWVGGWRDRMRVVPT
eukprot:6945495-Prymnesium_polylepis.1